MRYKFSLQIDDDKHSLSSEDGISINKLSELLGKLYEAIDADSGANCTLSSVRGNCYALDFSTPSKRHSDNFIVVHKNIEQLPSDMLEADQRKYAATLRGILGNKFYMKAYDADKNLIASIKPKEQEKAPTFYYSYSTVYGIVSELGGKKLESNSKHIYVDGVDFKIYIDKTQDLELKKYYGTQKLRIKVKMKHSAIDGHIVNAEMDGFESVGDKNIIENLGETGYVDFSLIHDTHTMDGIISKLYGNNT